MSTLVEILKGKATDKVANGLATYYDQLFGPIRNHVKDVLEIGVDRGGSIEGWVEFFPVALVRGIDCRLDAVRHPNPRERVLLYHLDATDRPTMREYFGDSQFDIIIDDGSHINTDVFSTFEVLWPTLRPGGYYVVEDIQVPYRNPEYPTIPSYFINFAMENDLKESEFKINVLWLRKER